MPAQWTAEVVAKMHIHRITKKQLAEKLQYSPEWVSLVLNGRRSPTGAEALFNQALDALIAEQSQTD